MQCSKCGTLNPDTQRLCGACGTPIPQPASAQKTVDKNNQTGWFIIVCIVFLFGASILGTAVVVPFAGSFIERLSAVAQALSPSRSSVAASDLTLMYSDITSAAGKLTEIKRNDYYNSLVGKRISDKGEVADVSSSGEIHVRVSSSISYDIKIPNVPISQASSYNLKDSIAFDGIITQVDDMFWSGHPILTIKYTSLK